MMTSIKIAQRVDELLSDERVSYPTADVFINAPLALVQISLQSEIHALQRVLQVPLTNFAKLRKET